MNRDSRLSDSGQSGGDSEEGVKAKRSIYEFFGRRSSSSSHSYASSLPAQVSKAKASSGVQQPLESIQPQPSSVNDNSYPQIVPAKQVVSPPVDSYASLTSGYSISSGSRNVMPAMSPSLVSANRPSLQMQVTQNGVCRIGTVAPQKTRYEAVISQGVVPLNGYMFYPCIPVERAEILSKSELLRSPLIRFEDELRRMEEILLEEERAIAEASMQMDEKVESDIHHEEVQDIAMSQDSRLVEKDTHDKENQNGVSIVPPQTGEQLDIHQETLTEVEQDLPHVLNHAQTPDVQPLPTNEGSHPDKHQEKNIDVYEESPQREPSDAKLFQDVSPHADSTSDKPHQDDVHLNESSVQSFQHEEVSSTNSSPTVVEESTSEDMSEEDTERTVSINSSISERQEPLLKPQVSSSSSGVIEESMSTAQEQENRMGPTGLPLFNLDRLQKSKEVVLIPSDSTTSDDEEMDENDRNIQLLSSSIHKQPDSSILVSQLSQMDDFSSVTTSDDEESQRIMALREGEAEVRNTATSSLLSLVQMNKAITKTVKDSEKQQQIPTSLPPHQTVLTRNDSLSQERYKNPREFLVNYVCHLSVWEPYHFQNSRGIALSSTYSSLTKYVETMMFCILEELAYTISESASLLLDVYGIKKNTSEEPIEENELTFEKRVRGKRDFEKVTAHVTAVGEAGGGFVHVRVDKSNITPYKWNEAVILLSSCRLKKKAKDLPLSFGVSTGLDNNKSKDEWIIFIDPEINVSIGSVLYLYTVTNFTSFVREFTAVANLRRNSLRTLWGPSLISKAPKNTSLPNVTNHSHIDSVLYDSLSQQLNNYQIGVVTALTRPGLSGAFLVEGPPGTGKTTTIVSIVHTLLSINNYIRIMITAPSNAAVDTILEKLVVVIPSIHHPSVVRLGRVGGDTHGKERNERIYLQKYELDGMVDRRIEMYRSDKTNRLAAESDGYLRKKFEQDILMSARVIVSTLTTSSNVQVNSFLAKGTQIPVVIVDEATQCTEPQCIIPLCMKPSLLILVGDSHQLAATIQNPKIDQMGYGKSLFERWEHNRFPKLSLRVQYRMTPDICLWPNHYVYNNDLINSKRVREPAFQFLFGSSSIPSYAFVDINESTCEKEQNSYRNKAEAEALVSLLKRVFFLLPPSSIGYSIGIITPYVAQVNHIRRCMDSSLDKAVYAENMRLVKVSSVDSFQGGESDIIILSCVRSKHKDAQPLKSVGFLSNLRRLNVSLTRAKQALWIIGNSEHLKINRHWEALINDSKSRNAFFSLDSFMERFNVSISITKVKAAREKLRSFRDNGDYSAEISRKQESKSNRGSSRRKRSVSSQPSPMKTKRAKR